ncbi:thiol reductant ABC exporter subunit CydD [Saccharibacillus sp. O16]|nr:thiol reductant ABC exporter subunit CydD [Saccharibacillus sp. O16]
MRLIALGVGAATIAQAVLMAEAVQRVFVEHAALTSLIVVLAALLAVMAARTLLSYLNGRMGLRIAAEAKRDLRARLLRSLASNPLLAARQGQTGGKISVTLDAVDEADGYFSQYTPKMIEASIVPLLILAVVFFLHVPSGLILLFTAPFIPLFMALVGIQTKEKSEEKFEELARFSGTFLDSLQGLVSLKLFGRAKKQEQEIERVSLSYRDATMTILKVAFVNTFALETIVMLGIGIVALELALQLVVFKTMAFHTAFLILLLVPEFYNLLKNAGTAFHGGRTSMGAIRNIELALTDQAVGSQAGAETSQTSKWEAPAGSTAAVAEGSLSAAQPNGNDTPKAKPEAVHQADEVPPNVIPFAAAGSRDLTKQPLAPAETPPVIELDQPIFRYEKSQFELQVGAMSIQPGQQIALVGRSGSGKTTLLHLIAGLLRPVFGEVRIDGAALTPEREEAWFRQVSYITQHPYIFAGTLAENIAIGAEHKVTREAIAQAAESAGLAGLIASLPQGHDTVVGEGGRGLSGGEKQRLALARAFLKRPTVLLFDEPTTGLDLHTERVLMRSIDELSRQATVITIAHRLHTIRHADCIWFMEQGRLIGCGSHEELLENLPQYAEMIDIGRQGVVS